jgi:hypothetical protein
VGHPVALEPAGVVEVELLQALAGREPGGADATFAAVAFPGRDLALQTSDQELSCVQDSARARSTSRGTASLSVGAFSARAGSRRPPSGHAPRLPSRLAVGGDLRCLGQTRIGSAETLRTWVRRAEVDSGSRPGVTTDAAAELARLKRENAELDRPGRR